MPAGEIITQDGRRCTKVRKDGHDATSIFSSTSTATNPAAQTTAASLTQDGLPSSSGTDGELPAVLIITSTSTSTPISTGVGTNSGVVPETSTLFDDFTHGQSTLSATEGSGLNLPAGSGSSRPSFLTTPTPGGSISTPGSSGHGSSSDGNEGERAGSQNPGIIAGGIIGAVVLVAMIIVAWICIRRRRRKQRLAESPTNVDSNDDSTVVSEGTVEKPGDGDVATVRSSQLPTPASYSTFTTQKSGIPETNQARNSGTPLVQVEGRPNSQRLESAPIPEDPQLPPWMAIKGYAAGIFGKLRGLYPSFTSHTRGGYQQQPSQNSSARSSYNERTDGPMPQRRLTDPSPPRPRAHDIPTPGMLNPFADPSSTNGVQRSPGFWRSPLARNPFEDPAPPDEDFPFPSPGESYYPSTSQHHYHESINSSVIVLPGRSSAGSSMRSTSLDATASEISRWRRERDSRISTRSDPFDLERSGSVRSNNGRRTTVSNTARSSQYLVP